MAVLLLTTLACGPAAPTTSEADDEKRPTTTPTATETPDNTDEPSSTNEPSATPEATEEPTSTSPPDPTQDPGDIPGQTATPWPTYPPTATPDPALADPVIRSDPHPDGVKGCLAMNLFTMTEQESHYREWCNDAVEADLKDNCRDRDGTEAQLACARERLLTALPMMRIGWEPCVAITDDYDSSVCVAEAFRRWANSQRELWRVWAEILNRVESDAEVKQKRQDIAECVFQKGYDKLVATPTFPWQVNEEPTDPLPDRIGDEQRQARESLHRVLNGCALQTGIYDVQDRLWLAEIARLERDDPEGYSALLYFGVDEALELEGPAPFLVYREASP